MILLLLCQRGDPLYRCGGGTATGNNHRIMGRLVTIFLCNVLGVGLPDVAVRIRKWRVATSIQTVQDNTNILGCRCR